jgi:hypothetical protein
MQELQRQGWGLFKVAMSIGMHVVLLLAPARIPNCGCFVAAGNVVCVFEGGNICMVQESKEEKGDEQSRALTPITRWAPWPCLFCCSMPVGMLSSPGGRAEVPHALASSGAPGPCLLRCELPHRHAEER